MISILFVSLVLVAAQTSQLPPNEEISQLIFQEEKAFFLTKSKRFFGFINHQTGQYLMQQELKEQEEVLRIDPKEDFFALRKGRNEAFVFNLKRVNIQQLNVQISFRHQKIVDLARKDGKFYVLTNKDLRRYTEGTQMTDSAKNILTSCRKKQWFLKFFDYGDFVKILLLRGQEICLRILKDGQKAQQKCLFNITSEVNEISKTSEGILLQTDEINYVIKNNMEAFSFKGKVTQVNKLFVTFGAQFKSFYIEKHVLIDGVDVQSNSDEDQFMLKESQEKGIILTHNGFQVQKIGQEKPKRAWIHKKDQEQYILALLFGQNRLQFKNIQLADKKEPEEL